MPPVSTHPAEAVSQASSRRGGRRSRAGCRRAPGAARRPYRRRRTSRSTRRRRPTSTRPSPSRSRADIVLHYAIADVGFFVDPDGVLDAERGERGGTVYLPDEKVPLYPSALSEGAASLLPDGPRPAVVFTVRIDEGRRRRASTASSGR